MHPATNALQIDENGFCVYEHKFILIASSGDVHAERVIAETLIEDVLRDLQRTDVKAYSWDVHAKVEGFDQRYTMQQRIPNPAHRNCLGVVYIVGERIGLPLETGFNPKHLGASADWLAGDHPVQPDWPVRPEEISARLDAGAFPLTGGVFEFLAARGYRDEAHPAGKPLCLCLLAPADVRLGGTDIALNNSRWHTLNTSQMAVLAKREWESSDYLPQIRAVHNLMRACAARGIAQNATLDREALRTTIRQFLRRDVFRVEIKSGNPYRELRAYDIEHAEHFHGRGAFAGGVRELLDSMFAAKQGPVACRITGWSGCGKSSVLRCGLARELSDPALRGRYRMVVLHPQEHFKALAGDVDRPLDAALIEIEAQAGLRLPPVELRAVLRAGAAAPNEAADGIGRALEAEAQAAGMPRRLIIALDQFEEIVDELASAHRAEYWNPLLQFVKALTLQDNVGLVYTLERSRQQRHDALSLPRPFVEASERKLDDETGDTTIRKIISRPFARTGYPLSDEVVKTLAKNFADLGDKDSHAARNSVLPLLALKLHHLWEFVAANLERNDDAGIASSADYERAEQSGITIKMLTDGGQTLDFAKVIDQQAGRAATRAGHPDIKDEQLDYFLQTFVGIEGGKLQLTAAPRQAPYPDEEKLVESFRRHRLLIDVGPGLVRIVHEALLDHWAKGRDWLESRRPFLEMKSRLRLEAQLWDRDGRERPSAPAAKIAQAAEILGRYIRAWTYAEEVVHPDDRALRAYCIAIFEHSRTPRQPALLKPKPEGSHVGLAALYGLVGLLKKFKRQDSKYLHEPNSDHAEAARPIGQAAWSQLPTVRFLLEAGADPTLRSNHGWPSLAAAIFGGRKDIFDMLMSAAKARRPTESLESQLLCPDDYSLVHCAALMGRTEMLGDLLGQYGFSASSRTKRDELPIHLAAGRGQLAAFDLLRRWVDSQGGASGIDAVVEPQLLNCVHLAAISGSAAIIDRIAGLPNGRSLLAKTDARGQTPLHAAAECHHAQCITSLLQNGLDPNAEQKNGLRPIHLLLDRVRGSGLRSWRADDVDEDAARDALQALLLDPRTDPNAPDADHRRPLALVDDHVAFQRMLLADQRLALGMPVRPGGDDAIFVAARLRVWQAVQRHVKQHGLPPGTAHDSQGNTFLHHLTSRDAPRDLLYDRMTQMSAEQLNARNEDGQTPFHRALKASNWPLARRMLHTELLEFHGTTMLSSEVFVAFEQEAPPDVLEALASKLGERLHEPDADGWTILHYLCASSRRDDLVRLKSVVLDDTQWTIVDKQGRRPIDIGGAACHAIAPTGLKARPWPAGQAWDSKVAWRELEPEENAAVLGRAGLGGVAPDGWQAWRGVLAFYPGQTIVRIVHRLEAGAHPVYYFIEVASKKRGKSKPSHKDAHPMIRLQGGSPPIHELNAKHLKLNVENAVDYLRFFDFFVRGEDGPFCLLEKPEALQLSASTTPGDRQAIAAAARPVWLINAHPSYYRFAAAVYYSNAIFCCYFKVMQGGMVTMESDFPTLTNLSGRVEMPIA